MYPYSEQNPALAERFGIMAGAVNCLIYGGTPKDRAVRELYEQISEAWCLMPRKLREKLESAYRDLFSEYDYGSQKTRGTPEDAKQRGEAACLIAAAICATLHLTQEVLRDRAEGEARQAREKTRRAEEWLRNHPGKSGR